MFNSSLCFIIYLLAVDSVPQVNWDHAWPTADLLTDHQTSHVSCSKFGVESKQLKDKSCGYVSHQTQMSREFENFDGVAADLTVPSMPACRKYNDAAAGGLGGFIQNNQVPDIITPHARFCLIAMASYSIAAQFSSKKNIL